MNNITTFTEFLLETERKAPQAKGNLTFLLIQIENATKIIASHIRESGLVDILGATGKKNSFEEEVQKLDELSNTILIRHLIASGQTYALISEELEKPLITSKEKSGEYIVYFDPLDGSSNIDVNCPIGTIFSIYHKKKGLLQKGTEQVAAGYVMYGSSTMLVFTMGQQVNGFTLDPTMGSFLLSHPDMKIPEKGTTYSINEAYAEKFDKQVQKYLQAIKVQPGTSLRYVGALIADIHRTLLKGGIFLNPTNKERKDGKLRLMLEVNPMSWIVEVAGGKITTGKENPLDKMPVDIHERSPLIAGSRENVLEYMQTANV